MIFFFLSSHSRVELWIVEVFVGSISAPSWFCFVGFFFAAAAEEEEEEEEEEEDR